MLWCEISGYLEEQRMKGNFIITYSFLNSRSFPRLMKRKTQQPNALILNIIINIISLPGEIFLYFRKQVTKDAMNGTFLEQVHIFVERKNRHSPKNYSFYGCKFSRYQSTVLGCFIISNQHISFRLLPPNFKG